MLEKGKLSLVVITENKINLTEAALASCESGDRVYYLPVHPRGFTGIVGFQ